MSTHQKRRAGASKALRCKYCRAVFKPNESKPNQIFCSEAHRLAFWKHGGLPFEKMVVSVQTRVDAKVDAVLTDFRSTWRLANSDEVLRLSKALEKNQYDADTLERARREVEILTLRLAELEKKFDLLDLTVSRLG